MFQNNLIIPQQEEPCIYDAQSQTRCGQIFVPYEQQMLTSTQQINSHRYWQKVVDANIAITKAACIEQIRTQALIHRQQLKEEAAERRKSEFDELILTKSGNFQIRTKNTSVAAIPRKICNATNFESFLLKNMSNHLDELLLIVCHVNNETKEIFLNPEKLENKGYITRKFSRAGVIFYLSDAKKKDMLEQIVALSFSNISSSLYLPDETGWIRNNDDEFDFVYIEEEGLTWKKALKMAN